jgi:hypothetical protein
VLLLGIFKGALRPAATRGALLLPKGHPAPLKKHFKKDFIGNL